MTVQEPPFLAFRKELVVLGKLLNARFRDALHSGNIAQIKRARFAHKITTTNDPGMRWMQKTSTKVVEELEPKHTHVLRFLRNQVSRWEEFQKAVSSFSTILAASELYRTRNYSPEHEIQSFCLKVLDDCHKKRGINRSIQAQADLLAKVACELPIAFHVRIHLTGIKPETEAVVFGDYRIRKVNDFDRNENANKTFRSPTDAPIDYVSSILEFERITNDVPALAEEARQIVLALALCSRGSVIAIATSTTNDASLYGGMGGTLIQIPLGRFECRFSSRVGDQALALLEPMKTLVAPSSKLREKELLLRVLRFYELANSRALDDAGYLAFCVLILEAIYLCERDPDTELSVGLGIRVSGLFGKLCFPTIATYEIVRFAYDIRSSYFHGSQIKPSKIPLIEKAVGPIAELARLSMVALVLFSDMGLSWTDLIRKKQIEHAVLDLTDKSLESIIDQSNLASFAGDTAKEILEFYDLKQTGAVSESTPNKICR